jgi:hypothetical protein
MGAININNRFRIFESPKFDLPMMNPIHLLACRQDGSCRRLAVQQVDLVLAMAETVFLESKSITMEEWFMEVEKK